MCYMTHSEAPTEWVDQPAIHPIPPLATLRTSASGSVVIRDVPGWVVDTSTFADWCLTAFPRTYVRLPGMSTDVPECSICAALAVNLHGHYAWHGEQAGYPTGGHR